MELNAHVGGKPGIDCGGFCDFCFYKNLDLSRLKSMSLGCVHCPPQQIGCEYCKKSVTRIENHFKPLSEVMTDIGRNLMILDFLGKFDYDDLRITISGGADAFFYPHLMEMVRILKESNINLHLGYVSGKGITDLKQIDELISLGLDELSYSVFSTDPLLRDRWMHDQNPQLPIDALKLLCENCQVNVSVVVIPGINDIDQIIKTGEDLEEWGLRSLILRRFANYRSQGLILNDEKPLVEGLITHDYAEFQDVVYEVSQEFSFPVYGLPYYDPSRGMPFAILKRKNRNYIDLLPSIRGEATIITGKLAHPFLERILKEKDPYHRVNVIDTDNDIADLINHPDLEDLDLNTLKSNIIIPGGALVHDEEVKKILSRDGIKRNIIRGPYVLTNHNNDFNHLESLENEYKSFKELIDIINTFKG
jgi:methanogenesis marker radical SAM protein